MVAELVLAALLLQPNLASKRSSLVWDHDGSGVTRWQVQVDSELPLNVQPTSPTPTTKKIPFPAITPGSHAIVVYACNDDICSDPSNVLMIKFVAIPDKAGNVRIVVE